jgi:hypothetical protein
LHLNLTGMSLAEWAATDMQWWYEAYSVQTAYRQGQDARRKSDQRQRELQAG